MESLLFKLVSSIHFKLRKRSIARWNAVYSRKNMKKSYDKMQLFIRNLNPLLKDRLEADFNKSSEGSISKDIKRTLTGNREGL